MSAWWDEQLAGYRSSAPLPAVCEPRSVAPSAHVGWARTDHRPKVVRSEDEWSRWWSYARSCAGRLAHGIDPPAIEVFGPVLGAAEDAVFSAELSYSRLYGGDGRYHKADLLVVGRPAVMAAGFALSAAVNHRRKVAARGDEQRRWRDAQQLQVVATTDRLLCNTATGWLSYWYGSVTEFYPDQQHWSLTLGFDRGVAPVRLSGPAAPAICVWAGACVLGDRWTADPRLAPLLY